MCQQLEVSGEFIRSSYYTLNEVCRKLEMPPKTFRSKFIQTGKVQIAKLTRAHYVIPGYELCRFFDDCFNPEGEENNG